MTSPRASIIVSSWNGRRLLETCLPRVLRALGRAGGDHEVIVVDDGSADDTADYVRREFPEVKLLALARNLRFARANNAGARQASGEVLVFLNNDMQPEPDFLGPLLQHFRDPSVFAVTARILMEPKRARGGVIRETGLVRARFEDGVFVLRHEEPESDRPSPVLYAGGGSSAVRRDRFLELGGFDPLFRPFYFEDLDVSYRAQKHGWKVLFEPRSRMVHAHRQTNAPSNFPGDYVDLMFARNSLLFTWKALTDPDLLGEHFRSLWRRLVRPGVDPMAPRAFLRAALQLPRLLPSRHRARRGLTLTDREVIGGFGPPRRMPVTDGGAVPAGSTGRGRRVLVLGFAPLPFERENRLGALCFRTWHIIQALLAAGHRVTAVGVRGAAAYRDEANRPQALRFRGEQVTYYSLAHSAFEAGEFLQQVCDEVRPEAIVAVHAYAAWAAARLRCEAPLWADLNGSAMTEAQARAAAVGDDSAMAEAWRRERAALARADAFSVVSLPQKYALIGELGAVGRLRGGNYGRDFVHHMPNAVEPQPYRHTRGVLRGRLAGESDFVVLWAGGYNTWTDVDTLFAGLAAAMREEPRLRFVSLGGAMPGRDERTFYRFREMAEASEFADRFVFVGWAANEEVPNYYFESDVGINIDRASYEMLIGCRYRILDMLRAGLPVVTSLGTEISSIVEQERLGATFPPGDADGLRDCLLALARDESRRRRCAERARDWVVKHRLVEQVMRPLVEWMTDPQPSADRMALGESGVCGDGGRASAARALPGPRRTPAGAASDLLAKTFVKRRGIAPWGLEPAEPPRTALVIRAGGIGVAQEVVRRLRETHPAAEVAVLSPEALEPETKHETGAPTIPAPATEACGYRPTSDLIGSLRERRFDTVVIAGEGNRRAELVALLSGAGRRVEVRDDGAAHLLWFAPHKPLLLALAAAAGAVERLTLTAVLGLVWGALAAEGWLWRTRTRLAAGRSR